MGCIIIALQLAGNLLKIHLPARDLITHREPVNFAVAQVLLTHCREDTGSVPLRGCLFLLSRHYACEQDRKDAGDEDSIKCAGASDRSHRRSESMDISKVEDIRAEKGPHGPANVGQCRSRL